jgi:hypothetical protein
MTWTLKGHQGSRKKFNMPSAKMLNVGAKLCWVRICYLKRQQNKPLGGEGAHDDEVHMLLDTGHDICSDEVTDQRDKLITPRAKSPTRRAKTRRDEKVTSKTLDEIVVQSPKNIAHLFLVENSKVMGSAAGVSPEIDPNLDYGINEDVQDSEQGLRWKEFLDRATTSQEKGKALLSAMELTEDFVVDNIAEGLSVEAYMSFAKEVNRDIMPVMGSCDSKCMQDKGAVLDDVQEYEGDETFLDGAMACEEDRMESTLEEGVVLSEEVVKSIELARNIEQKKQKEKGWVLCW